MMQEKLLAIYRKRKSKMRKTNILIVESDKNEAHIISETLQSITDYHLIFAKSAKQALQIIQNNPPDLLICNVHLDMDMEGVVLVENMQAFIFIPIIFIGQPLKTTEFERLKATHPINVVLKPYHAKELEIAVDLALYNFYNYM
jgi:CheY-like chemotaxis protein